jgi:branched-chain amino acid aminotransferase
MSTASPVGSSSRTLPDETAPDDEARNGYAWIEGQYVPIAEARIPILDMGLGHSDATYDVVAVWDGSFFRLEDHLARLERGRERIHMRSPLSTDEIRQVLMGVVQRSGLRRAFVEAINTRGVPARGERDPRRMSPRFYAYAIPYQRIVTLERDDMGTDLIIVRGTRRIPADAVDPTVKNFQWGDLVRGMFEAYDRGGSLPVLTDGAGNATEGPGFNVFAVIDGALHTPAKGVLEGITRRTVIELARKEGITVLIDDLPIPSLTRAEEVFLTSTAGGVVPVATLDGEPVGTGQPGPFTTRLRERYWELHYDARYLTPVDYGEALRGTVESSATPG